MKTVQKIGITGVALAMLLLPLSPAMADAAAAPVPGEGSPAGPGYSETEPAANLNPVNAKIGKDEAVERVRKLLDIPGDFKLASVGFSERGYGFGAETRGVWRMEFVKEDKQKRYYAQVGASLDADSGELLGFNTYLNDPERKPSFPPKVDFAAAKAIAAEFVKKMAPGKFPQVRLYELENYRSKPPLQGDVRYQFRYDRIVNGIPYKQNAIRVTVDGEGHVLEYSVEWDDTVRFEPADKVISLEEAEAALKEHAPVSLQYVFPYQKGETGTPWIAYRMQTPYIDAVTGEPWYPAGYGTAKMNTTEPVAGQPLADMPRGGQNLTKEQAAERLQRIIPLPAGVELEDASYEEYTNPESGKTVAAWNLRWSDEKKADGSAVNRHVWARINSSTGELMHYSLSVYPLEEEKDRSGWIDYGKARELAVELVKKALPHYADQLYLQPDEWSEAAASDGKEEPRVFYFRFQRYIGGVEAAYENVEVAVDRKTGQVESFSNGITDRDYPPVPQNLLPEEKALDLLLSEYSLALEYVLDEQIRFNGEPIPVEKYKLMVAAGELPPGGAGGVDVERKAKPVYLLVPKFETEPHSLDAVTGEWRSLETGDVISLERVKAEDISGHWAEQALQLMIDYGAIDVRDGKVRPNALITRGELIKMLVIAMNGGVTYFRSSYEMKTASFNDVGMESPYFAYVEEALSRQLIDQSEEQFHPDDPITREEMAELIARALGYGKLAQYESLFRIPFSDAAEMKAKGPAAIAVGLGIMTLKNGKFEPRKQVTRAEAATAFYRYLQVRPALQDRPLY